METKQDSETNQSEDYGEVISNNQISGYSADNKSNPPFLLFLVAIVILLGGGIAYLVLSLSVGSSKQQEFLNTESADSTSEVQQELISEPTEQDSLRTVSSQIEPLQFENGVEKREYDDPDENLSISLYKLREFVNRVYGLAYDIPNRTNSFQDINSEPGCDHEYIKPTVERYRHGLTCVQDEISIRFSSPYMFDVTSYCTDSSGFSGLVISSDEKAEVLCKDAFTQMESFDPNNPDLVRINSFNLPEFNRAFSTDRLNQEGYKKLKQYYGKYYGEGSYTNSKYGYSLDFPSTYVVGIESGDTQNINQAKWVELTGGDAGPTYAQINVRVQEEDEEWVGTSIKWQNSNGESGEIPLEKIQRDDDYVLVSEAKSRPHNDQSDELRAVSMRTSYVLWSEDGESSPLVITIQTMHSSQYDEVNFAYNYKYHEFLKDVIVDTLKVDK